MFRTNSTILNFICKFTFYSINLILNGLIIRNINLNLIGIANLRLQLIYTTIFFFTRESLRRNVPKLNNIHSIYHYINLIWLFLPIGICFILFLFFLTLFIQTNSYGTSIPYYNQACFMYACAAFIELLSEPFYLLATVTRNYHINVYIQFIASIIGFSVQTILLIRTRECSLWYYGIGYIIYSLIITLSYYICFLKHTKEKRRELFVISSLFDLLFRPTSPFIDHKLVNDTMKLFKQAISMKILTDGEKYLMIFFYLLSDEEQGIFHMIYLLGSDFPRLIFSTIEQISLNYFQQTFSITKIDTNLINNNQFIQDDQMLLKRRKDDQILPTNNQQTPTINEERTIKLNALTLLQNLIRLSLIISILLIIFIIPYSSHIINIYIGSKFSINSSLIYYLRLYLINILLNSINIFTESFIQSIMSIKQLNKYKNLLLSYSLIYLILIYLFVKLFGITGLIIINCLNLLGRIIINSYLINRYFIRIQWSKSYLVSSHYILLLLMSFVIFNLSQNLIENSLAQISFAFGLFLTIVCLTFIEEKEMIHYIYCFWKLNYQVERSTFFKSH